MSLLTKITALTTKLSLVGSSLVNTKVGVVKTSLVTTVNTGLRGQRGTSAYETAVALGYPYDEATWIESLHGAPGADSTVPGPPGADSTVPGPPGADSTVPGPKGDKGDPGDDAAVTDANISAVLHTAAAKNPPVDADEFSFLDSAAAWIVKKITWAQLKVALWASPMITGWLRRDSEVATYGLAAGTTLPYPTNITEVPFQFVTGGASGWTKVFEGIVVYTADANRIIVRGEINFGGSAIAQDGGPPYTFIAGLRVASGGALSTIGNLWWAGQNPGTTVFPRIYYRLNGSGQYVLSIYFYDAGATVRRIDGKMFISSGHATDVLQVWQGGLYTAVDPAGANTEIARTGQSAVQLLTFAGTTYTITGADHMRRITFTSATPVTIDVGESFLGLYTELIQGGAGQLSVVSTGVVPTRTSGTAKSRTLNAYMYLRGVSTTLVDVMGDVSSF